MCQGKIAAQGTPTDLASNGLNLITPDGNEANEDKQLERQASNRSMSTNSLNGDIDGSEHGDGDADEQSRKLEGVQLEASSKGKTKGSKLVKYFIAGARWSTLSLLLFSFVGTQILGSAADIWVSIW